MTSMLVAFEFKQNKISNHFVCGFSDEPLSNLPTRPKRGGERLALFPLFTHIFKMTKEELDRVWFKQDDYTLENDILVGSTEQFEPLSILKCDWTNGHCIDNEGFITSRYVVFNDEKPPSYVVMTEPPNNLKKPKWTGTEWIEGYVEEVLEPSEIDVLKEQIKVLQQEMENLKA